MPQHKSAKKRMKTNAKCQERNRAGRSTLRTSLKQIAELKETNRDEAIRRQQSVVDKAVGSGLMHPNKAARLKSRMSKSK